MLDAHQWGTPVRDFDNADDVMANARAVQARRMALRSPAPAPAVAPEPVPPPPPVVVEDAAPVEDVPDFLSLREKWLDGAPAAAFRVPDAKIVTRIVAKCFRVSEIDIISVRRDAKVVRPRQIACWLMRYATTMTLPQIGRRLGDRDHTTILHSVRKIDRLRASDPVLLKLTDKLLALSNKVIRG